MGSARQAYPPGSWAELKVDAKALAISFAEAFCAADLERLESLLSPDLQFRGPLFQFESRAAYLGKLREDPPAPGGCRLLRAVGSGQAAAVLYEYERQGAAVVVAQFTRTSGGLIADIRLVFDTAQLMSKPSANAA